MTDVFIIQTVDGPVRIEDATREQLINALKAIYLDLQNARAVIHARR